MRKIIATARVSLDGVMQGPGAAQEDTSDGFDLGGWITQFRDAKGGAATMSLVGTLDRPYDVLLGRKTYGIFADFWRKVPADDPIRGLPSPFAWKVADVERTAIEARQ